MLEDYEHARARGARIHAELVGYGLCTDATHMTRPSVAGQAAAMRRALDAAAIQPDEIGYINAHGSSTPLNDPTETKALKDVFGERAYTMPISGTKGYYGHALGASGGARG